MKYKCMIFDLDGTIYFGTQLAHKANEVIVKARNIFGNVLFVTNNSAKSRQQIFEKLVSMGLDVKLEEIVTSSYAIARYLSCNKFKNVYCIGTESLKSEIKLLNIDAESKNPQAVVVGYNPDFKLSDLDELLNINLKQYKLIVANKERCYPKENGYIVPGAGPIVSAVENLLEKTADVIVGKPNVEMLKFKVSDLNVSPCEICVVGDSFNSDILMAKKFGADGILITKNKLKDCKCIENLCDLLEIMQ